MGEALNQFNQLLNDSVFQSTQNSTCWRHLLVKHWKDSKLQYLAQSWILCVYIYTYKSMPLYQRFSTSTTSKAVLIIRIISYFWYFCFCNYENAACFQSFFLLTETWYRCIKLTTIHFVISEISWTNHKRTMYFSSPSNISHFLFILLVLK